MHLAQAADDGVRNLAGVIASLLFTHPFQHSLASLADGVPITAFVSPAQISVELGESVEAPEGGVFGFGGKGGTIDKGAEFGEFGQVFQVWLQELVARKQRVEPIIPQSEREVDSGLREAKGIKRRGRTIVAARQPETDALR